MTLGSSTVTRPSWKCLNSSKIDERHKYSSFNKQKTLHVEFYHNVIVTRIKTNRHFLYKPTS